MNAAEFNDLFKIGDPVIHDPAPLLGDPPVDCVVDGPAVDVPGPEEGSVVATKVPVRLPDGKVIDAMVDHLRA